MSSLIDRLSPTPIHAPCAVRVGGHSFGFGAQFFPVLRVASEDGAEGRFLSPVLGANVSTLDHGYRNAAD
ncbi:hypothetical protein ACFSUK_28920 [Sphingobium scionense]|uniref:Uncharacterized protein n=1 Tax=Sphingobium scionense TaxID=1404341 RepID=A0A7W6LPI0_9SPHN|nr:hypothetical protein [Sphingobium scionense]MBB4147966.1 hypothetical protein [Sphingobium scionense]